MTIEELYSNIHGNYTEAKTRMMNDRLIERFVLKFPGDPTMHTLEGAMAAKDVSAAFAAAHTLKGVAANLAFTELTAHASALTEQLRPKPDFIDEQLYDKVLQSYFLTIAEIRKYELKKV